MTTCKVEWCINVPNRSGKGYCRTHYDQIRHYGQILNKRTTRNPNEIINYGDYAEMLIYNQSGDEIARAIIDVADVELVSKYKWSMHNNGYVRNYMGGKTTYLHRLIISAKKGEEIDHINLNKLDNRKDNLRLCEHVQNCWNRRSDKRGVGIVKRNLNKKYYAKIGVRDSTIHLGYFYTEEEAMSARLLAEKKHFKEFMCQ
jgi:hypothetical protein